MLHTHTQEYHSAIKNETMPFTATQMGPETIIPSEAGQIKTNTKHCLHVESKNDPNEPAHKRETDSLSQKANPMTPKGKRPWGRDELHNRFIPSPGAAPGTCVCTESAREVNPCPE